MVEAQTENRTENRTESSSHSASNIATPQQARFQGLTPVVCGINALVIGCGALGSSLVKMLARMGVASIYVVDHDIVSRENVGVQEFDNNQVGQSKVACIEENCNRFSETMVLGYCMLFERFAETLLGNRIKEFTHVFMCVDTMLVRKEISDALNRLKWQGILVDGRLSANTGWVFACRNTTRGQKWYTKTLFKDSEGVDVAGCAVQMTGYSAHIIAGLMVAQGIRFAQPRMVIDLTPQKFGLDIGNMLFLKG